MLYIVILAIGFIGGICFAINETMNDDWIMKILMSFVLTMMGVLITGLICLGINFAVDAVSKQNYEQFAESNIVALQDNSSVSGNFFLGSGNIRGSMQYVFMTKTGEEFNMINVDASSATVIYSSESKVEEYHNVHTNKIVSFLFGHETIFSTDRYKLYVPKGTIKQNYNIDLK